MLTGGIEYKNGKAIQHLETFSHWDLEGDLAQLSEKLLELVAKYTTEISVVGNYIDGYHVYPNGARSERASRKKVKFDRLYFKSDKLQYDEDYSSLLMGERAILPEEQEIVTQIEAEQAIVALKYKQTRLDQLKAEIAKLEEK